MPSQQRIAIASDHNISQDSPNKIINIICTGQELLISCSYLVVNKSSLFDDKKKNSLLIKHLIFVQSNPTDGYLI